MNYTCNCKPGYTGRHCTVHMGECQFGFCQNNGTCSHTINNCTCHCLPGFTDFNCSTNINECEQNSFVNSANCTNLINGYNCNCLPGFTGNNVYNMEVNHCFDRNYVTVPKKSNRERLAERVLFPFRSRLKTCSLLGFLLIGTVFGSLVFCYGNLVLRFHD